MLTALSNVLSMWEEPSLALNPSSVSNPLLLSAICRCTYEGQIPDESHVQKIMDWLIC